MYDVWTLVQFYPPEISIGGSSMIAYSGFVESGSSFSYSSSSSIVLPEGEILGSVVNYIHQAIRLSDNDYFGVGGHDLRFSPTPVDDTQVLALADAANQLLPFRHSELPGTAAELKAFATNAAESLEVFQPESSDSATVFLERSSSIEGIYVNGQKVDQAPKLDDHFSLEERLASGSRDEDTFPVNSVLTEDGYEVIDVAVEAETGSNILINNVLLKNFWTASVVTAVVGDHIEINAILQVNAWADNDTVTSAIDGWEKDPAGTQALNIAAFERHDTSNSDENATDLSGDFPKHWVINEIDGDLMIVNWLQQHTFMMDNDIGILSSSGVTTSVYSGENVSYNDISIYELAFVYDLIIIGGSVFDLNIIQQLNIMIDNDLIGAVDGFQTIGEGSYSTSANLLWNNAYVANIGSADRFDALPDHYRQAAEDLANGKDFLNYGVLSDPAFAGYGPLNVLYVKGDLLNVQYVKQTNILGDSDQLALAMHASPDAYPDAEWSVTTGNNALINNAAIVDLDSFGMTYVGGSQYSEDILVQADIFSSDPEYWGQNPDVLVNEAIAFLDDEPIANDSEYGKNGELDPDCAHGDALQTLIG